MRARYSRSRIDEFRIIKRINVSDTICTFIVLLAIKCAFPTRVRVDDLFGDEGHKIKLNRDRGSRLEYTLCFTSNKRV